MKQAKKKSKKSFGTKFMQCNVTSDRYRFILDAAVFGGGWLDFVLAFFMFARDPTVLPAKKLYSRFAGSRFLGLGESLTVDGASVDMTGEIQSEHEHE